MKKLKLLLLIMLPILVFGQSYTGTTSSWTQYRYLVGSDSGIVFKPTDTFSHTVPVGTLRLNFLDWKFYSFNGVKWIQSSGSGGASYSFTAPLSESLGTVSINLSNYATLSVLNSGLATKQDLLGYTPESTSNKTTNANGSSNALYPTQKAVKDYVDLITASTVKYADTAATLLPYAKKAALADSTNALRGLISSGISNAVKYSDTSGMLSPYAGKTALTDTAIALRSAISSIPGTDTSGLSNRINARVKYTDTATMLNPYLRSVQGMKYADTAGMLSPYLRANQGVKYTDTAALVAPYASKIDARAKYTDTAAMLAPYATKAKVLVDSNALATATNARVKYTDTAAMLSAYLRDGDSVSLSNRINLKIDSIRRMPGSTTVQMKINGTWVNAYTDSTGSGGGVSGSGTSGYLPKFTGSSTLGNSLFRDNGSETSIGGAPVAGVNLSVYGASAYRLDLLAGVGLGNLIQSYDGGSSAFRPLRYSASQHDFQISGTTKATIDGSGDFYLNSIVGTTGSNPLIFKFNGVECGRLTGSTTRYGYNTTESGGEGIVIGALANNSGFIGTAIGYAAQCSGQEALSIGRETIVAGAGTVGIGRGADVNGSSVGIGRFAYVHGDENVSIGSRTRSDGTYSSICIGGYSSEARASYAQAYGKLASSLHLGAVVINTNLWGVKPSA